jgi:hypothetical protein
MRTTTAQKVHELRSDYQTVFGRSWSYFYCPILFRDEETRLCKAHIVNRAFHDSSRAWTIQRADVDGFFGSMFEGDFVDIQYFENWSPDQVIVDPEMSKRLRPEILLGGERVEHFVANGPVPMHFSEAVVGGPSGAIHIGLKIHPSDASLAMDKGCQVVVQKDVRLHAAVSLLKAAHLTLFDMLGYRYALSPGGDFLGRTVLGDFFLKNRSLSKVDVLRNAASHFREFANMVRPVAASSFPSQGTASDRFLFVCECEDHTPWGLVVFVKTSDDLSAVLVPVMDAPKAAARFVTFLHSEGCRIEARPCRFEDEKWMGVKQTQTLEWPKAEFQ